MKNTAVMIFLALGVTGCASTTGIYRPIGERYPQRSVDCDVLVYKDHPPTRPYAAVSRLNVHLEKTFFVPSDYWSASGELKKQACLSGAEAVIDIEEEHSSYLETRIYNLTATGIRFLDQASAH